MSVILDIDMPNCCAMCPLCYDGSMHDFWCAALDNPPMLDNRDIFKGRQDYCPLREADSGEVKQ